MLSGKRERIVRFSINHRSYFNFHSGIQVKCEGKAQTEWSEEEKDDDDVKYVSKEKYFEEKKILAGKGKLCNTGYVQLYFFLTI